MNRDYLEDYSQREASEYDKLKRRIRDGSFSFTDDRYPPDERFVKIQKPVAFAEFEAISKENLWAQLPFCGSLVVCLVSAPESYFEEIYFKKTEIDGLIDFTKETGKLQFVLSQDPIEYEGLDFLEPIFQQLKPPALQPIPDFIFGNEKDIKKATETFATLARLGFTDFVRRICTPENRVPAQTLFRKNCDVYCDLKLGGYKLAEEIENLLVDDPAGAEVMLLICRKFISEPLHNMRFDMTNFTLNTLHTSQFLPLVHQPTKARFPCEIGKFLMKDKLTFAPYGMEAFKDITYHYDAYDLRKVQEALNEGIVTNHPDIVAKNTDELSEILDNVWNDKTIPNRIKNIEIGVPVSIAAIGGIVAGLSGLFAGGFLSELGYKVVEKATEKYAEKLFGVKEEGLTERLAKLRTKSYQANIYDFKKKYNK
ncbi:hypothetical protein MUP77_12900 [Candidatus Bathyarchaeota archaeon]|nr:hypothetical protein [Candidatus Bathyarchaeota archaeon]